jgi:hypothetical protein
MNDQTEGVLQHRISVRLRMVTRLIQRRTELGLFALVAACSSGGGGGSGGGGVPGGGDLLGGSSGSSGGSGGSSGSSGVTCTAASSGSCSQCLAAQCCSQARACNDDPICSNGWNRCTTGSCRSLSACAQCIQPYQDQNLNDFLSCITTNCAAVCWSSSPAPGSGLKK